MAFKGPAKKTWKPLPKEVVRHAVWHEGGGIPTVIHEKWEAAYRAACLLAEANPGERFHVMQSRAIVRRGEPAAASEGDIKEPLYAPAEPTNA